MRVDIPLFLTYTTHDTLRSNRMLHCIHGFPPRGAEAHQGFILTNLIVLYGPITLHTVRIGEYAALYLAVPNASDTLVKKWALPALIGLEHCSHLHKPWSRRCEWVVHALLAPTKHAQHLDITMLDGATSACLTLHWAHEDHVAGHLWASADDTVLLERVTALGWTANVVSGLWENLTSRLHTPQRTTLWPLLARRPPEPHIPKRQVAVAAKAVISSKSVQERDKVPLLLATSSVARLTPTAPSTTTRPAVEAVVRAEASQEDKTLQVDAVLAGRERFVGQPTAGVSTTAGITELDQSRTLWVDDEEATQVMNAEPIDTAAQCNDTENTLALPDAWTSTHNEHADVSTEVQDTSIPRLARGPRRRAVWRSRTTNSRLNAVLPSVTPVPLHTELPIEAVSSDDSTISMGESAPLLRNNTPSLELSNNPPPEDVKSSTDLIQVRDPVTDARATHTIVEDTVSLSDAVADAQHTSQDAFLPTIPFSDSDTLVMSVKQPAPQQQPSSRGAPPVDPPPIIDLTPFADELVTDWQAGTPLGELLARTAPHYPGIQPYLVRRAIRDHIARHLQLEVAARRAAAHNVPVFTQNTSSTQPQSVDTLHTSTMPQTTESVDTTQGSRMLQTADSVDTNTATPLEAAHEFAEMDTTYGSQMLQTADLVDKDIPVIASQHASEKESKVDTRHSIQTPQTPHLVDSTALPDTVVTQTPRIPRTTRSYSTVQAAELLGVTPKTIRRWADAGKIAYFRDRRNNRRIRPAEIERIRLLTAEQQ